MPPTTIERLCPVAAAASLDFVPPGDGFDELRGFQGTEAGSQPGLSTFCGVLASAAIPAHPGMIPTPARPIPAIGVDDHRPVVDVSGTVGHAAAPWVGMPSHPATPCNTLDERGGRLRRDRRCGSRTGNKQRCAGEHCRQKSGGHVDLHHIHPRSLTMRFAALTQHEQLTLGKVRLLLSAGHQAASGWRSA